MELAQTLTRGEQQTKSSIDYVLGTLVYDNLKRARYIVQREVADVDKRKVCMAQIEAMEDFLKVTYLGHIAADGDPLHDPSYALEETQRSNQNFLAPSGCKTCLQPLQVVENIKFSLRSQRADIVEALSVIQHKLILYTGHQHRCLVQENRISEVMRYVKDEANCDKVAIIIDYKMKFEPIRYREKTSELFGKKGMS